MNLAPNFWGRRPFGPRHGGARLRGGNVHEFVWELPFERMTIAPDLILSFRRPADLGPALRSLAGTKAHIHLAPRFHSHLPLRPTP
jgi:hypothetical protein